MKTELKGKLEFIDLFSPVKLFTGNGTDFIDLREHIFKVFDNLNGKRAKMNDVRDSIEFIHDESSDRVIEYKNTGETILILIKNIDETGYSNIGAYLPNTLQSLNGRTIIVTIPSDDTIKITNDPDEKVYGLYYTDGNCCKIPDDQVKSLCKPETSDCCIFLAVGGKGFECLKFCSVSARMLLDEYSKGKMNASRIGNCAVLGRDESRA